MRDVYSNARKTIAWLGDEDNESAAAAIATIRYVHEVLHKGAIAKSLYEYNDRLGQESQEQLNLKSLEEEMKGQGWSDPLGSVDRFFSCPWWDRVW